MGRQGMVTDLQRKILDILDRTGGVERHDLLQQLGEGITDQDLAREFSALRHMEKVRAEKRQDRVFLRLW